MIGYPSIDKPWLKYYCEEPESSGLPSPDKGVDAFLRECSSMRINAVALDFYGTRISYRSFFEKVDEVAAALSAAGVDQGDIVSVCGLNTPEFIYLFYGINRIGAVSNWLSPISSDEDLNQQLKSANSKALFVVDLACEKLREAAKGTAVDQIVSVPLDESMPKVKRFFYRLKAKRPRATATSWRAFLEEGSKELPKAVDVRGDDPAVIEYTGGSTGVPKGVVLSNKNLNSYFVNLQETCANGLMSYQSGDVFLAGVPLFLAFGISSCCHGPLCHGLTLLLAPDPSPEAMCDLVLKRKPNHIVAGRVGIDSLSERVQSSGGDLSSLRSVMYGGEAANAVWEQEMTRRLGKHGLAAPILNGYGMTETSAAILFSPSPETEGLLPVGNVCARVTDPDDPFSERGYNEEGELCLSSDTVMLGYYQNEEETAKAIVEDGGRRWVRTQDLATISEDGLIRITGRLKRIYHRIDADEVDTRVYPMRIENVLAKNPLIAKCAVVGVPDKRIAYRTFAYVVLRDSDISEREAADQIGEHCRANLPDSHVPDKYVFVSDLPLTRASKVNYRELERRAAELVGGDVS